MTGKIVCAQEIPESLRLKNSAQRRTTEMPQGRQGQAGLRADPRTRTRRGIRGPGPAVPTRAAVACSPSFHPATSETRALSAGRDDWRPISEWDACAASQRGQGPDGAEPLIIQEGGENLPARTTSPQTSQGAALRKNAPDDLRQMVRAIGQYCRILPHASYGIPAARCPCTG